MRRDSMRVAILVSLALILVAPVAWSGEHTVRVTGSGFNPASMTIAPGETVTWVNEGGLHNVVAADGSFTSGPPSTDLWNYSHILNRGGVYDYSCEVHAGENGRITVAGVFGDRFESGGTGAWLHITPITPNCDCYFSNDCFASDFCDYGPGGFGTEDICYWRDNKPVAPGTGCDAPYDGPWIPAICDGSCAAPSLGSGLGWEDMALIREGLRLWAEAILQPAEAGGGPIDPVLAEKAMALGFEKSEASVALGRQVADLLAVAGVPAFSDQFCHFEGHPGESDVSLYVDLSRDPCRRVAARRAIDGLLAELETPGAGKAALSEVRDACPDWRRMFAPRCPEGDGALACFEKRVADLAIFLKTPRALESYLQRIFAAPEPTS